MSLIIFYKSTNLTMQETIYFMVLVSVGSLGLFLAWKRTGNYDVDFFIKIIGWIMLGFSIYGIIDLTQWITK
ncbi:MAG: hypothetical protein CMG26_01765 [Candidatus Marinimicrobia bacterium]|nr:hypothetical protein [Candidatus Neomarinimicrobiota bacterium]MBV67064.1 hypothetical protein [Candidatus Neomarinimicrobiota bacterium]